MNNSEAWKIYQTYLEAWNEASVERRSEIMAGILAEDVEYQTAQRDTCRGRGPVLEDVAGFHERFPGGRFEIGDVSSHHDVALLTWVIVQADSTEFARGGDQIAVGPDGKIRKIVTFAPSARGPG